MLLNLAQISTNNPLWVDLNICLFCYFFQVGIHLSKWVNIHMWTVNCFKHLMRNSFSVSLGTMFLPNKVRPRAKLNGRSKRWLILKYSFPTRNPFKSKIICKGLTSVSFAYTGKDLKPSRVIFSPLSSSVISWRTLKSLSFLAPSNPIRGDCNCYETNGVRLV